MQGDKAREIGGKGLGRGERGGAGGASCGVEVLMRGRRCWGLAG